MREKLWLIIYAFKNALIGMKRHWVLCLSSVTTVFLTLSLAAVLIIAELHVNRFSENLASDLEIHVVLNDDVLEQETIDSIAAQINDVDNVRETVFSDKDHELEMMIEQKGEPFTAYRGEENPLSHAFFVKVEDETLLEPTRQEIALIPGVQSAYYGGSSVSELVEILQTIRWTAAIFTLLLLILSLYLIYNAIRSSIQSRATEIGVMRTVGATTSFIRIPFEIEGTLIGLMGAILPWILMYYVYPVLYHTFGGHLIMPQLSFIPIDQMKQMMAWILFGSGALSGYLASLLAANRYIRKIR